MLEKYPSDPELVQENSQGARGEIEGGGAMRRRLIFLRFWCFPTNDESSQQKTRMLAENVSLLLREANSPNIRRNKFRRAVNFQHRITC